MQDMGSVVLEFVRSIEMRGVRVGSGAVWILVDERGFECRPGGSGATVTKDSYLVVRSDRNPSDGAFAGFCGGRRNGSLGRLVRHGNQLCWLLCGRLNKTLSAAGWGKLWMNVGPHADCFLARVAGGI